MYKVSKFTKVRHEMEWGGGDFAIICICCEEESEKLVHW